MTQTNYLQMAKELEIDLSEADPRRYVKRYTHNDGATLLDVIISMLYFLHSTEEEEYAQYKEEGMGLEEMTCIPYADDLLEVMKEEALVTSDGAGLYTITTAGQFLLQLHYRCG